MPFMPMQGVNVKVVQEHLGYLLETTVESTYKVAV